MSKFSKSLLLGSVLATSTMISGAALAEVSANVGVTSNYIWRGVTQSADEAAVSGGLDYSHESGFYAGTWVSSLSSAEAVDFTTATPTEYGYSQYEHDLYFGFAGETGDISYDIGYIQYMYPVGDDVELDFSEITASVGFGPATLSMAQMIGAEDSSLDKKATYMSVNLAGDINKDFGYSLTFGSYTGDDIEAAFGDTYTHYALGVSKGDFSFGLEKNNIDGDDFNRFVVSWGKEL